jgi:hypothetical protein
MRFRWLLLAVPVLALALAIPTTIPTMVESALQQAAPFYIDGIEVTQSQQTDPRGYPCHDTRPRIDPLVAKRRTGVRVYVYKGDTGPLTLQGELSVFRGATLVWKGRSLNNLSTLYFWPCSINRPIEGETLNFEIPYKHMTIGLYTFSVRVFPVGQVAPVATSTTNSTVVNRRPPRILGVPIDYQFPSPAENVGTPEPSLVQEGKAEVLIWGAWPVSEPSGTKRYMVADEPYVVNYQVEKLVTPNPPSEEWRGHCRLSNEIGELRFRESPQPNFVYGFMRGSWAGRASGWTCGNRGAVGNTDPVVYQKTFAHEFGHEIGGEPHLDGNILEVGWDVWNVIQTGRPQPMTKVPIMSARNATTSAWAQIEEYRQFMTFSATTLPPLVWEPGPEPPPSPSQYFKIDKSGASWALDYGLEVQTATEAITPLVDPAAAGQLKAFDALGAELYATDVQAPVAHGDEDGGTLQADTILVQVPALTGLDRVEFYWQGALHSTMTRSANAPVIKITSPSPGATLGPGTTISWSATDNDNDPVTSFIEYTHNGGTRVIALAPPQTDPAPSVTIDGELLPASANGEIKIRATDGLNTTVETVTGLQVGPDKPPRAFIVAPPNGANYLAGVLPILVGSAHDPEDGELPEASMTWTSNLTGLLGTGAELEVTLTPGIHTITLDVVDSAGNHATDQIVLTQQ